MYTVESRVLTRVTNYFFGFLGVHIYETWFKTRRGSIIRFPNPCLRFHQTHVSDFLIHVSDFPTHVSDFPNPCLLAWIIGENAIIDEECNETLNNKEIYD